MRDKHERETDALLDALYQAKVERDRANARSFRIYSDWQKALKREQASQQAWADWKSWHRLNSWKPVHEQNQGTPLRTRPKEIDEMQELRDRVKVLEAEKATLDRLGEYAVYNIKKSRRAPCEQGE